MVSPLESLFGNNMAKHTKAAKIGREFTLSENGNITRVNPLDSESPPILNCALGEETPK